MLSGETDMPRLDFPVEKIPNEELLRLATEQSPEQTSVLIELALPSRQVDFQRGVIERSVVTVP
jgi:hypothetical protein